MPKEPAPPAATSTAAAELGEPTDRMIAAILPAGDQAWFFKVVGPLAAVESQTEPIDAFLASVELGDDGRPQWQLPADWQEEQGGGMRAATIRIPTGGAPLELSVIGLPWRGTPGELLSNINRWRGQMKLPEASQRQLAEFTREITLGDATLTVVDLRGQFTAGPAMSAPFAGGAGSAPRGPAPGSQPNLPPGHPPIDEAQSAKPPAPPADSLTFEPAAGWQPLAAGGMRKAAFQIGGESDGALVTVIDFPADAGPMIADPLQNVNRWRREVGLAELNQSQLDETVESIEVDGHAGSYVALIPDTSKPGESQAARATLAALVNSGKRIWFFKMTGSREVVAGRQAEFKDFLKSVRFAAEHGGRDGDK